MDDIGRGAPRGNKNAVGNKGGAPKGNKNHLIHGGYATVTWDTLTDEERSLIDDIPTDEKTLLIEQIRLYTVRERRELKAIQTAKEQGEEQAIILRLNSELTRIQRAKNQAIDSLTKLNVEGQKLDILREKNDTEIENTDTE